MAQDLWLEDDPRELPTSSRRRHRGVAVAGAACLLVVAIPVSLIIAGGSDHDTAQPKTGRASHVGGGRESHHVLTALNATTGSGNFEVSYTFGGQDSSPSTTTTTTACGTNGFDSMASTCGGASVVRDQPVTGTAIVDVQPFAMVATSEVSGFGTVVLRDDGTDVWEEGGGDYGLSPGSSDSGPGSLLTGFASLAEGTLGPRQGALAMLGLASPTGYLNLDPAETGDADLVGTGTVDGAAVTIYQISMTPAEGGQVPGLTAQEQQATSDALAVLSSQGYTGSTVLISIDGAGYIRRTQTTDHFADGTTMTSEAEFSNFGCAGTVVMPGQSGAVAPPAGCTSPDDPSSAQPATTSPTTAPSTAAPPPAVPSTTVPPTTAPSKPAPSTTAPSTTPSGPTTTSTSTTTSQPRSGPTTNSSSP